MKLVTKMFIRARESVVRNTRGQTMTEYALILAAIARTAWPADQELAGAMQRAPASDPKLDSFSTALRS